MDTTKRAAYSAVSGTQELEKEIEKKLTLLWNDLPTWQRDNHYIHTGYRTASDSYRGSFNSLFYLHNESVNIYTHLIGAICIFIASLILYHTLGSRYDTASREDVWVFSCYFLGAIACLGMSATYHTISNHSHAVAVWGNQLDYAGIVLLIWGSFIPVLYYGFQRDPQLMKTYFAMVSSCACLHCIASTHERKITTLAAGTMLVSTHPSFRTPALRPFRALMFVLMGLSAVFPVLHGTQIYGVAELRQSISLDWVLLQGALYIAGAAIYAARVPEKWRPGEYDILGSSHQVFHVLVLAAAVVHLIGLVKAFDYEHSRRMQVGDCFPLMPQIKRV